MLVVILGLLTYGILSDLSTQAQLHTKQAQLADTRALVKLTVDVAEETEDLLRASIANDAADQVTLDRMSAELSADHQRLAKAQQDLAAANVAISALTRCVAGVNQAVGYTEAGDQQAAIQSISGVLGPCETLDDTSPGGPVYPFDFPDPDVIDVAGKYFAYGTNSAEGNIQILTSTDLSHWTPVGDALPELPSWASPDYTWSPAVFYFGGRYLLYYAVADGSLQCISVASADRPQGPFVDSSTGPLECQKNLGGSIDPSPYVDESGRPYLTWKSNGGGGDPATIWAQPLSVSATSMAPGTEPTALLQPSQSWEGSVVEGPDMWVTDGTYYLFYSGNEWSSASYAEGVAVCQGPLGPCSKPLDHPILASQSNLKGPGSGSVFTDSQGNLWLVFDGYLPDAVGYPNPRLLFFRRLTLFGGLPQVMSPG